jgi:hypothetical protein
MIVSLREQKKEDAKADVDRQIGKGSRRMGWQFSPSPLIVAYTDGKSQPYLSGDVAGIPWCTSPGSVPPRLAMAAYFGAEE